MKKKKQEQLNIETLSIAMRQTTVDLISCERSSRYAIDMYVFHSELAGDSRCVVCFAGASMARRCGAEHGKELLPNDFPREEQMLQALDCVRNGDVMDAASYFDFSGEQMDRIEDIEEGADATWLLMNEYDRNPKEFV